MAVLINFKICDNAGEWGGIEACPTHALYWDEQNNTIAIDNSRCTNCMKCEGECPIGAIKVAKTDEEYREIKNQFENDPRKIPDLFIDRYGAMPIHAYFLIKKQDFNSKILNASELNVLELFTENSVMCLLYSIPIKELFENIDFKYKKMEIKQGDNLLKKYNIKKFPSLLFFKNGKLIGKVEGYYEEKDKDKLLKKINIILKNK